MTVCGDCARKALEKFRHLARTKHPIRVCVHCKQTPLNGDPNSNRWPKDRFEHYFCEKCVEKILYRETNICLNCKKGLTARGHKMIRHSQSTPGDDRAYMRKEFGRKVA